jgi:hypothetical protein
MRRARAGVPGTDRFGLDGASAGVVMLASVVDGHDLLQVIWTAMASGIGLVVAGSLAIHGAARAPLARREGHTVAASLYAALAIAGALACVGGVVLGVSVMLSKG